MNSPLPRHAIVLMACCCSLVLASCAVPKVAPERTTPVSFEVALDQAVDDLISQTQRLPAFMATVESKMQLGAIVVDPLLDSTTGQQNALTRRAEKHVVQRVSARFKQFEIVILTSGDLPRASYLLTGVLSPIGVAVAERGYYRLSLSLTEVKSGIIVAQAGARIHEDNLDTSPTPFFRDSPVLAKDRVFEGYVRTAESKTGTPADPVYLERLNVSALLADASKAYDEERIQEAMALYATAAKRPGGQQMKVFAGLYLTQWRLGRRDDAENAFGMVVRLGLATNSLSVKFLFKPGSTDFIHDMRISEPYPMWLRQIARQTAEAGQCVNVIGHTSRTGTEQYNERLSLLRAATVKSKLEIEVPASATRLRQTGMGFRENIVGSGTDDLRDALDRRVEFRGIRCEN